MLAILNITLPLFLLIGVGYSAIKLGFLNLEQNRGLGSYVLNFAYPALVFNAISTLDISSAFIYEYVFIYGGPLFWTKDLQGIGSGRQSPPKALIPCS